MSIFPCGYLLFNNPHVFITPSITCQISTYADLFYSIIRYLRSVDLISACYLPQQRWTGLISFWICALNAFQTTKIRKGRAELRFILIHEISTISNLLNSEKAFVFLFRAAASKQSLEANVSESSFSCMEIELSKINEKTTKKLHEVFPKTCPFCTWFFFFFRYKRRGSVILYLIGFERGFLYCERAANF